jgi:hypothetical protein
MKKIKKGKNTLNKSENDLWADPKHAAWGVRCGACAARVGV